jgi:hypothetical protein
MAALKEHQAFLKGKRKSSPLPLASEFIATARQWIEEYNSQHPHGGRGMRGRTPDDGFWIVSGWSTAQELSACALFPV